MSGPDDILESGSRRPPMRMPARRTPGTAVLLGAAGLIVGPVLAWPRAMPPGAAPPGGPPPQQVPYGACQHT